MTYLGSIKNGVAVLDPPVTLPDGTRVRVEVEAAATEFGAAKSVEELAREQGVQPNHHLSNLLIGWPPDESMDDFLAFVREVRR